MAIDPDKYAALIVQARDEKPAVCEVLEVLWADGVTRYYAGKEFDQTTPFRGISKRPIEARLMYSDQVNDPFSQFELQGDLRTQDVNFEFSDLDKDVANKFRQYGTVRCKLHYYYPTVDLLIEDIWYGELHQPSIYGLRSVKTAASNGWRSREALLPGRTQPNECTAIFGGKFTTLAALATNGCRYDRHLGGSNGLLDPSTGDPFIDCPRMSTADCTARWGDAKMFLGFTIKVPSFVSDPHNNVIATTTGNTSMKTKPLRVIAGFKHLNNCEFMAFTRMPNPNHPELGFIQAIWQVGEGPNQMISNITANDKAPNFNQWVVREGWLGQTLIGYPGLTENFSLTAMFRMIIGLGDPVNISPQNVQGGCDVTGNKEIAVYSNTSTFTRGWTDDRAWWLFACYENQRWGLGSDPAEFWIQDFIDVSAHLAKNVTFSHTFPDGETISYGHRRSTFNAVLEPRPAADQIADICRSGRISVPFQYQGKLACVPFRAFTTGELDDAPIFTDHGDDDRNIFWNEGVEPAIQFSQIPPDKLTNEIKLVFEERDNKGLDRPIKIDDPDQKYLAGKARGENNFFTVPKEMRAFGVDNLPEALKLGYGSLWFGDFDEGGIKNNCRGVFRTSLEHAAAIKRYGPCKLDTDLLEGFESPTGVQFEYFRVLYMQKIANGMVEVTVQAYNKAAYEAFEIEPTVTVCSIDDDCPDGYICVGGVCVPEGLGGMCTIDAECPDGFVCRDGVCVPAGPGEICILNFDSVTYNEETGNVVATVLPC